MPCTLLIDHRLLDLVEDVRLVVSELATNAFRHAYIPFTVTLGQVRRSVPLTVTAGSPDPPVQLARARLTAGGRGLSIVAFRPLTRRLAELRRPGQT